MICIISVETINKIHKMYLSINKIRKFHERSPPPLCTPLLNIIGDDVYYKGLDNKKNYFTKSY